jgi:phosphopantothenoylcysteine synthetase/decarboxylase
MRILVTAGGTKVPIDPVRHIGNDSKGTFPAAIAKELLHRNAEIIYLVSKDGKSPFSISFDFYKNREMKQVNDFADAFNFAERHRARYEEHRFRNFGDYIAVLGELVSDLKPDAVLLAAAVSDYLVEPAMNKIRTGADLTLNLYPADKVIRKIKLWCSHTFLVGFKLLNDVSETELVNNGISLLKTNRCDLVVANDLKSIRDGCHTIFTIEPKDSGHVATRHVDNIAGTVADLVLKGVNCAQHPARSDR